MSSKQDGATPAPAPQKRTPRQKPVSKDESGEPKKKFQGRRNNTEGNGNGKGNGANNKNNSRRNGNNSDNRKPKKTLLVSNVDVSNIDLENRNLTEHYKEQRVNNTIEMFREFGEIDSVERHLDANCLLITYVSAEDAGRANKILSTKNALNDRINKIRDSLVARKMAASLAPHNNIRVSYAERQVDTSSRVISADKAVAEDKKAPKAKKTEKADKTDTKKPAKPRQEKPKQENRVEKVKAEPAPVDRAALLRETELVKHKETLDYIQKQQEHVRVELTSEEGRCKSRDVQIQSMTEELKKLLAEVAHLEKRINKEQEWKKDAETRRVKLGEELAHFDEEERQVKEKIAALSALNSTL